VEFIEAYHINLIFRIIVSGLCGIAIGFERNNRAKEAGIRTHCIVACASALMMIISKYGFYDLIQSAVSNGVDVRLDPSRMAQGIVTGVGFLGAGMIYIQRGSIKGLTTASGIWATSGIGMAVGAGMYIIGITCTVIILGVQFFFHHKTKFMTQHKTRSLVIYGVNEEDYQNKFTQSMSEISINISDVSIKRTQENTYDYTFYLDMPEDVKEEDLVKDIPYLCKIDFIH
jgi:putative Mg2+ transporter-C (MgtC) family protein